MDFIEELRETGKVRRLAPVRITMTVAEQASIDGRRISRWVNDKTGLNGGVVLTDDTLVHEIKIGERAIISAVLICLDTLGDNGAFELVATENADGTGAVTPLTIKLRIMTATAQVTFYPPIYHLFVPLVVPYSTTTKAITGRVTTNDAEASVCIAYEGYWEKLEV